MSTDLPNTIFCVLAAILTSCASHGPSSRHIDISSPFDEGAARRMLVKGTNQIRGTASMRQRGGGVVTCAGRPVFLVPTTAYANERLRKMYRSNDDTRSMMSNEPIEFSPDPPQYLHLVKQAFCNARGFFFFDQVADGDFYVTTSVSSSLSSRERDEYLLLRRVSLKDSALTTVVLTR